MITVEMRTGRSKRTRLLQFAMRKFKPYLTKIQPEQPAGSPRLTVPSVARRKCVVTERNIEETWLYDLIPKDFTTSEAAKRKRIY